MSDRPLKTQNWIYLVPFVGAHHVAFYAVATGVEDMWEMADTALRSAIWAGLSGCAAVILNGVVGDTTKAVLVFWRLRDPLPGSRAFSTHIHADPRINPAEISRKHGELPTDPAEQNRLWYRIYRSYESEPAVRDAHRSYLATRDMAALGAVFLITLGPLALVLTSGSMRATIYFIALAAVFGLAALATRNYGTRMVTTVLALESTTPPAP